MKVTWAQVHAWRLKRQFLDPQGTPTAVEVAERLGGLQAQVMSCAEAAVAVRQKKPDPAEVPTALWEDRTLVKTWAMRGTLHLLPSHEAGHFLTVMASLEPWRKPSWQKTWGVTPKELEKLRDATLKALDGETLTRAELVKAIGPKHLKEVLSSGWGTLLKPLAWWGVLCHGPSEGQKVTFARPDQWVKGWKMPTLEKAASHVVRTYLGAYGPAGPDQLNRWLFVGMFSRPVLRGWFEAEKLAEVEVEGTKLFLLPDHLEELEKTKASRKTLRLPAFDQFVLGPGTNALPKELREKVSRKGGWISPVVVTRGVITGTWE